MQSKLSDSKRQSARPELPNTPDSLSVQGTLPIAHVSSIHESPSGPQNVQEHFLGPTNINAFISASTETIKRLEGSPHSIPKLSIHDFSSQNHIIPSITII